ncbi:MAG TPA: sigma-70 family RNA polymerase sigma factor [Gammaproteobacteria bacterium]|nr:sigma-70 family RNA polymerase sigma factor [Xanthomonadales bacterium]HOP22452.1 sigma-70 family RNA polymerase sigma factor [Gammaproteobacteria bacterium]MCB1594674.1 sigma-70 family RNA polymerase sigma factor [Xanthomonadales bacterium]MCB1603168.1 sigma-70 family RNA polymerase sigma factor [Xanthomonadales bacterium]HPI94984.1 sigma-70 family RNA polymerase sigma factor [Gammaproteobacteria bacterium]
MRQKERKFDALIGHLSDDLYRFAFWLCKNEAMAQDLVQETYLRAWRALDSLKDEKAAKSWIFIILRREFVRQFEKKIPPITSLDELDFDIEDSKPLAPDDKAEADIVRDAILKLEKKYSEPLILQVIGGFSCDEIAEQLNISKSAVMTQLFRARAKLQKALSRESKIGKVL